MKTIFHKVLLKEIKTADAKQSIITEPDYKTPIRATVICAPTREPFLFQGGEVYFQPVDEGDIAVFFLKDAKEIMIKKEKHYIIDERDILYFE